MAAPRCALVRDGPLLILQRYASSICHKRHSPASCSSAVWRTGLKSASEFMPLCALADKRRLKSVHELALVHRTFADAVRTVNDRIPIFKSAINFVRWCASAKQPRPSVISSHRSP